MRGMTMIVRHPMGRLFVRNRVGFVCHNLDNHSSLFGITSTRGSDKARCQYACFAGHLWPMRVWGQTKPFSMHSSFENSSRQFPVHLKQLIFQFPVPPPWNTQRMPTQWPFLLVRRYRWHVKSTTSWHTRSLSVVIAMAIWRYHCRSVHLVGFLRWFWFWFGGRCFWFYSICIGQPIIICQHISLPPYVFCLQGFSISRFCFWFSWKK